MAIKPRILENILTDKFLFKLSKTRGSDHRWYELQLPDLPIIMTMVSHSRKEINDKLESIISRQLRVRHPYFKGMVNCNNNREDYYLQVKNDPFPPWDVHF